MILNLLARNKQQRLGLDGSVCGSGDATPRLWEPPASAKDMSQSFASATKDKLRQMAQPLSDVILCCVLKD
jgi:hypothetical protein